jgi:transcriptional regulator with XRE-family HTH domain
MLRLGDEVSASDAVRVYIRTLRDAQEISQDTVADAIRMARRTYTAWEAGTEIKDIKAPALIRAIKFLGGAFDHLEELENATDDHAEQLARDWIKLTPEQRVQVGRIHSKFRRVIELGDNDPARLEQVVQRLRNDARTDPAVLDVVIAYLDGRRSSLPE